MTLEELLGAANDYFLEDNYQDAILSCNQIPSQVPEHIWALIIRAQCHNRLGNLLGSLADVDEVLRLEPENACALMLRAEHHLWALEYDQAEQCALQAIQHDPDNVYTYSHSILAGCYHAKDKWDKAIEHATIAIRDDSEDVDALAVRADCYRQKRKFRRAVRDASRVIELQQSLRSFCYLVRAACYCHLEGHAAAFEDISESLRLDPESRKMELVTSVLGECKSRLGLTVELETEE